MSTAPTLPPLPAMYCGPDTGNVNIWLAEDLRAWGEACATAHASDLAQRVEELERQLAEAKDEIRVSDQLLTHRQQLLEAIHECPAHGPCVPHALEWVEKAKAFERDLAAMTTARDVAVELGATYAARADELAREAMTWRNKHDEMRALLDSRPAINAGLVASYITWNGQCYQLDWLNARDAARKGASL